MLVHGDILDSPVATKWVKKEKTFLHLTSKEQVPIEQLAEQLPWDEFCMTLSNQELREHGHHAIRHYLRTRDLSVPGKPSLCKNCAAIEMLRQERLESDSMSALPHPDSRAMDWVEFTHHASWDEFVAICSPSEVRRFAAAVRDALCGEVRGARRVE